MIRNAKSHATQDLRHIALTILERPGDETLLLRRFRWTESLSEIPEGVLELESLSHDVELGEFVGKVARIRLDRDGAEPRLFEGVITNIRHAPDDGVTARYVATVRPWIWLLTKTSDCRIFQGKAGAGLTTPQIIKKVLKRRGLGRFRFDLSARYRKRDYTVQYRESEFNFISRLMEEEGIGWRMAYDADGATLVMTDAPQEHPDLEVGPFDYRPTPDQSLSTPCVTSWTVERQFRSGSFVHRDYDFGHPTDRLESRAERQLDWDGPPLEVFDYPGTYLNHDDGASVARTSWEREHAMRDWRNGATDCRWIEAGATMTLGDHPRRQERGGRFLVISAVHEAATGPFFTEDDDAAGEGSYRCGFRTIPADRAFRPERQARRPRVDGPQTAKVVGNPKSKEDEEIYTDAQGRVKVQFHWDRYGREDADSSCWIRVSQAWAGTRFGGMVIPRVGQEVIVDFLEGDPDRPIITGRVYNAQQASNFNLPADKARSGFRSNSTNGHGGYNEILMDDTGGTEGLHFRAQYDHTVLVNHDRTTQVGNDSSEQIGNNMSLVVDNQQSIHVKSDKTEQVDASKTVTVGDKIVISAGTSITLKCGASTIHMNQAGVITISGTIVTMAGAINCNVAAPITNVAGAALLTNTGAVNLSSGVVNRVTGASLAHFGGATAEVIGDGDTVIQGSKVKIN